MKLYPLMLCCVLCGAFAAELSAQKPPKSWFRQTKLDLGKVRDKRELTATFSFANPTGKPQRWFNFSGG